MLVLLVRVELGVVVGGVNVWLHIPHLVNGPSCSNVHTWQVEGGSSLGEGEGGTIPSPPTSIGQNPADMDGEVFGGEDGEGRGGGRPLKRKLGSL